MKVQEEIVRRAHLETGTGKRRVYSGKHALSSIVYCAHCGDVFQRTHWYLPKGKKIVWRCITRLHKKTSGIDCPARTLYETDLHTGVVTAINQIIARKDELLPGLKLAVERAFADNNSSRIAEITVKVEELQKELIGKSNINHIPEDLRKEIDSLRDEKHKLILEDAERDSVNRKVTDIMAFMEEQEDNGVGEYSESLVRRLVEKITVFDDRISVEFKSGIVEDVMM